MAASMMNFYQPSLFQPRFDSEEDSEAEIFGKPHKKQRTELKFDEKEEEESEKDDADEDLTSPITCDVCRASIKLAELDSHKCIPKFK